MKHLYKYMDLHLLTSKERDFLKFQYDMMLDEDQIKKALYLKDDSFYRYRARMKKFVRIAHDRYKRAHWKTATKPSPLEKVKAVKEPNKKEMRQELKDNWIKIHHFSSYDKIKEAYDDFVKNPPKDS